MEHFFSPNSSGDLRSDAHLSQTFGGNAQMKTILKLLGGDTVKLLGGIYPPIPPGFGTPAYSDNLPIHVGGSGSCVPSTQIAMSEPSIS